jgi:O-antigen/teichoic acid export membrane protein
MLIRQTLLYIPAGVLGPLLQLATLLVWTHWLKPDELGLYTLVIALQDLLHLLGIAWWSQYVLRYGGIAGAEPRDRMLTTERGLLLLAGLAQAVIVPVLAVATLDLTADPALLLSIALATLGRTAVTHWSVRARAEQRIGLYALAQTLAPALGLALALFLFVLGRADLAGVFLAMAVAYGVVAVSMGLRLGGLRQGLRLDGAVLRIALRYGTLTTVGSLFAWISIQSIRFTNEALLGSAAVGLLAVGWGIGQRIASQIGVLATTAVLPIAVAKTREMGLPAGLAQLSRGGYLLATTLLPATIGLALLAEPMALLVAAEPFQAATAQILPFAMMAGAARVLRHHYLDEVLQLIERPGLMTLLDAVEAALTVLFCYLGALWLGMLGSVAGCLVAAAVTTLLACGIVARHGALPNLGTLWPSVLASALMAVLLLVMPRPHGLWAVSLHIVLGGLLYGTAMFLLDRGLAKALGLLRLPLWWFGRR